MIARVFLLLTALLGSTLPACSDSTSPDETPEPPISPVIGLPPGALTPFSQVPVTGLSAYDEDFLAEILDAGGAVLGPALIDLGKDDEILLTVPPHPDTPLLGGTVEVRITDGEQLVSQAASLEIAALTEHPGALSRMVAALQAILDAQLTINGTTREALRATAAAELRDEDLSLFAVQSFLDDPSNVNSLLALSNGPIPFFEDSDLDLDLVDSVIGSSGFDAYLETVAESLQESIPEKQKAIGLTITNMAELSEAMEEAALYNGLISDNAGQVLDDVGLALGVVGVFSGGSTAVIGAGLWGFQKVMEVGSSLLPSSFVNSATTVELSDVEFDEDDPGPGIWVDFTVVAQSRGMSLDKLILESILQGAGFGTKFGDFIESFGGEIAQEMVGFVITEATNAVIGAAGDGSNIVTIDPQTWTVVSTADPLTQARIVQGAAVDVTGANTYEPVEVGTSLMWVETVSGAFGGQVAFRQTAITVNAIEVLVTPAATSVDPGEEVLFSAEVLHAQDPTLEWTASAGTLTQTSNTTATLQTPLEAWDDPIVVKAISQSTGGIRVAGTPERSGQGLVSTREGMILIEPFGICVPTDGTETFSATILGFPPEQQGVTWSAARGFFSGNTYNAPSTPGPDTITATSVVDESVTASVSIDVATCSCFWSIQVSGATSGNFSGSEAEVFHVPGAVTTIECNPSTSDSTPPGVIITVFPSLDGGQTGSFDVLMSFSSPGGLTFVNTTEQLTTLTITKNDGENYEGSASGQLITPDPNDPENLLRIDVSFNFRGVLGFGSGGNGCE